MKQRNETRTAPIANGAERMLSLCGLSLRKDDFALLSMLAQDVFVSFCAMCGYAAHGADAPAFDGIGNAAMVEAVAGKFLLSRLGTDAFSEGGLSRTVKAVREGDVSITYGEALSGEDAIRTYAQGLVGALSGAAAYYRKMKW